jgi:hypothetical protein
VVPVARVGAALERESESDTGQSTGCEAKFEDVNFKKWKR